jgi:hypothetical protein
MSARSASVCRRALLQYAVCTAGGVAIWAPPNSATAAPKISKKAVAYQDHPDGVARRFGWDNTDIRYADQVNLGGHNFLWGVTANNNPTVWNTIPAWRFPYISPTLAPMPSAAPFIDEVYAQQVVGLSAYSFLDNMFYVEFGGYRPLSTNTQLALGVDTTGQSPFSGIAPYWRVAVEPKFWQ